ncbi:MAG: MmpS family transport accessory protein, partial [Actinomycetes bacterium]
QAKPFNPKYLRYEVFGPAGTVADISFFDANGDPFNEDGVSLPWSLEFPITAAASIGSVAAQGDSGSIGCRILVDGEVKSEKITTHEVSSFTSCLLSAA